MAGMLRKSLQLFSLELYSGPVRALWELLQNADDCSFQDVPRVRIVHASKYLWLEYNEGGFLLEDVRALCNIGASTKQLGQTGQKGIGFKASFVLSARPHVFSNPFRFFFDEEASCPLPQVTPQVIPAHVETPQPLPQHGTAIYLPLRKAFPDLLDEVDPTLLLFLRQVRAITVERLGDVLTYALHGPPEGFVTIGVTTRGVNHSESEHKYFVAKASDLSIAFPLHGAAPASAAVSTTLPLSQLAGLRTPLNAPFDLTANREALMDSERNARLRDALAELWLTTVAQSTTQSTDSLSIRAWLLQPGLELAQTSFWAPFVQRVRSGLREVPLIPVTQTDGAKGLLPINRCRKPDSPLLAALRLTAADLGLLGLGLPVKEYMQHLAGTDTGMAEFDASDLIQLLSLSKDDGPPAFQSRGAAWRKDVVKALAKCQDLDLLALRQAPLFLLAESIVWTACGEDHIFSSVPKGAPANLLRVLDKASACPADKELLKLLGCGSKATHRDVAHAIVKQTLGLTETEDHRFSWTNLAYLGRRWQEILNSSSADRWLANRSAEEMEGLMRSLLVPSCMGLLHEARELESPYLLGCKPGTANYDRSRVLKEPPGEDGMKARLWWELVFLRFGAQVSKAETLKLPKGIFKAAVSKPMAGFHLELFVHLLEQL
ncbi:unnamed protein product [Effrenium voratum]|nr:unnamed protein product [Effrenium voratum]